MTPEAKARQHIDRKLEQAGWIVQDMKDLNLDAGIGVAVREFMTDGGPADYVLFVYRRPVGVIEAKNLNELYDYVTRRLLHVNAHNDLEALEEIQGLMSEIRSAWETVPALIPRASQSNMAMN